MKAFITGGTGFIGSHMVDHLLRQGDWEIDCLVRSDLKWLEGRDVHISKGDLFDLALLNKQLEGVDVVFHSAGVVKAPTVAAFERGNVEATENLLRLAIKNKVPKVVILSSLAAAGPSQGIPLRESDPMQPVSRYGESKKRMEEMIKKVAHEPESAATSITIIRPPAVYGPREQDILTIFKMTAKGVCPIIGDGSSTPISMVHVKDLIQGMELAAKYQNDGLQTYYISGDLPITWDQFRLSAGRALGKKVKALNINPKWVQKIAAGVETVAGIFGSYPVLNREKAKEMVLEWTCSIEKARTELNFQPKISLDEGMYETIQWYKSHHWI
jgi:dihydroflavonol-4-reductase